MPKLPLLLDVVFDHDDAENASILWDRYPASNAHYKYISSFEVVCIKHASFSSRTVKENILLWVFKGGKKRYHPCLQAILAIGRTKPAVVLVHGMHNSIRIALLSILFPDIPLLVQHHAEKPSKGLKGFLQKQSLRRVKGFFFHASALSKPFADAGMITSRQPVFEIPEGSVQMQRENKALARKKLGIPTSEKLLLGVARLVPGKGLERLLIAFSKTPDDVQLYLVYNDASLLENLKAMARTLSCSHRVHWVGEIPPEKMHSWYAAADVFVSASEHEGSGFALMEALACGCFPLVSPIPAYLGSLGKHTRVLWLEQGKEHLQISRALALSAKEHPLSIQDFSPENLALTWSKALMQVVEN